MNVNDLEPLYQDVLKRLDQLEDGFRHYESIFRHIPVGVIAVGHDGLIRLVNPFAKTMLELEEIEHRLFWDVFTDDYFGLSMRELIDKQGRQKRLYLKLGESQEIEVIATSSIEGATLVLNDRTQSAKLERTLQHNNQLQALGEMAANLAHEIRNPLGGIEGFASMLKEELGTADHRDMAKAIIDGSRTLNALVTSVLDYSKPLDLHFQQEDLKTIVEESCALSNGQAKLIILCDSFPMLADKERLKLAFLNLIRNGWEASDQKQVLVTLDEHGVTFQDRGCGIDPKLLPEIFTPFFTTKKEGTGLGLPEAHKVIRAHGGRLEVKETSEKGTVFEASWESHD